MESYWNLGGKIKVKVIVVFLDYYFKGRWLKRREEEGMKGRSENEGGKERKNEW